jgi:hypothetical protein
MAPVRLPHPPPGFAILPLSALTVICAPTQLLQRQLARMDGFADGDRARLVKGLAAILTAARALTASARQVPGIREDREAS